MSHDSEDLDKSEDLEQFKQTVSSILTSREMDLLGEEVKEELNIEDPDEEKSLAALRENEKTTHQE